MPAIGPQAKGYSLAQGLLGFLSPGGFGDVSALGLAELSWSRHANDLLRSYPASPYLQCPQVKLRLYTQDMQMGPPRGGQAMDAQYKLGLVYKRQQKNFLEDPQPIMVQNTEILFNLFTNYLVRIPNVEAVVGWEAWKNFPLQIVYHDDLEHEWGDPAMKISVSEIVYTIEGRLATYYSP